MKLKVVVSSLAFLFLFGAAARAQDTRSSTFLRGIPICEEILPAIPGCHGCRLPLLTAPPGFVSGLRTPRRSLTHDSGCPA
jgi:hypothetical protein